jgi:hypothetical protein
MCFRTFYINTYSSLYSGYLFKSSSTFIQFIFGDIKTIDHIPCLSKFERKSLVKFKRRNIYRFKDTCIADVFQFRQAAKYGSIACNSYANPCDWVGLMFRSFYEILIYICIVDKGNYRY